MIEARIHARKISGVGVGIVGDTNTYIKVARVKNVGGVVTIGVISDSYTSEDMVSFNTTLAVSGASVLIRVTGSANNNITWTSTCLLTS